MSNTPNLNPEAGQVLTYNGPTEDASWETVPTSAQFAAAMLAWFQALPTYPGPIGTFWNNGGTLAFVQ